MRNVQRKAIIAVLSSILLSGALWAQSDFGTISGYIKDPSGATVPGAAVTVSNQSGLRRQARTDASGFFSIPNLPPGYYTMTAQATGFQKFLSNNNKLDPSGRLALNVQLKVGATTQTVEVTAQIATLQTQSAAVQKLVTRQQIDSLELNGRNPVNLAQLAPGAQGGNLSGLNFNFGQGPSHFNGSRNWNNLITYDGAPATRTRANGTSLGSADEDSTEEVQVLGANYSAEYGRTSGGQIRIVTKSGGPHFHGAAYEYVRNTMLNANTWQRNTNPNTAFTAPDHYNDFGYNIGGPFYIPGHFNTNKDKVFWYWGHEFTRNYYTDTSSMTVPTMLMRNGNFSELLDPNNIFYGHSVQLVDPKTGQDIPGNVMSTTGPVTAGGSTISPNGLALLKTYPQPNLVVPLGSDNWTAYASHPQRQQKKTISVDVNVTPNQRLRYRGIYYSFWEYQPLDGGSGETPKYFDRPNFTNSLDYTWVLSPTKVNELLFSVSHDRVLIPVDQAHFFDKTTVGLNFPYIYPISEKLIPTRISTINMSEFSRLNGGPYPSHSAGPIVDLSDNFSWVKSNHTIKFGGVWEWQGENNNDEINVSACNTCTNTQNGQFLFSDNGGKFVRPGYVDASSGAAIANAALGLFDSYSEIGHRAYTIFRGNMYDFFAQDAWSVTSKLHVDYGVRYSLIYPYHADWGNMIVFDPNYYDPSSAVTVDPQTGLITGSPTINQLYNGMVIPGSGFPSSAQGRVPEASSGLYNDLFHGLPNYYGYVQKNAFQPRAGVAYRLDDKTVLRAGIGRFITRLGDSDSIFLGGNPPFQPNASTSFGIVDNPGGTGVNPVPLVVTTAARDTKSPEAWTWNFTVERQMPWHTLLSVAYVGSHGLHLQRQADINQPTLATVAANPGVNLNALRPYKGFGSIRQSNGVATSQYKSLQIGLTRPFTKGLLFSFAYTLAKSMDSGSNVRDVVPNTYDTRYLWGPSEFDARDNAVASVLYKLPFFNTQKGFAGQVLGGWEVSSLLQFQSGTPCGVAGSSDYAGVGLDSNFGCGVNGQYWVKNGDPKILGNFGSGKWFTTTNPDGSPIFTAPPAGTFNNQYVRDIIYQPGFNNWNFGLFKSFPIRESMGLQFRAEAFNFLNHPNWGGSSGGGVNFNPTSSTFGEVTTKGSERNIQLSLRFYF
ncbi:MAG TPA: carboxypeptidase regulatory-like domain-containing protein [Terriglobia bacterium]|nr:carboxypeptidase regulatory-like domain-containing protein [Terriglobia bacterium]